MPARLSDRSRFAIGVTALTLVVFLVGSLIAILTPAFRGPDETRHFNSVLRLMQGGGWPQGKASKLVEGTYVAAWESGFSPVNSPVPLALPKKLPAFTDPSLPAAAERTVVVPLNEVAEFSQTDQMTQHPPLYYAVSAGVLTLLGGDGWRWDQLLLGMRMISALLLALSVPFIVGATRLLTRNQSAAMLATAASLLCIPALMRIGSAVNNDNLLILSGSAMIYFVVRAARKPEKLWSSALGAGVALGAGLLTKGFMLCGIPVVGLVLLVVGWRAARKVTPMARRFWQSIGPVAASLAIGFAIGGWWWVRNLLVLGTIQPSRLHGTGAVAAGYSLPHFLISVFRRFSRTFWSLPDATRPYNIEVVLTALVLIGVAVVIFASRDRWLLLAISTLPLAIVAVNLRHSYGIYRSYGSVVGSQGRYLFIAIALLVMCVALAWVFVTHKLGATATKWLTAAAFVVATAVVIYGFIRRFSQFWLDDGESFGIGWSRMIAAGAGSTAGVVTIGVLAIAAYIVTVVIAVHAAGRQHRPGGLGFEPSRPSAVGA